MLSLGMAWLCGIIEHFKNKKRITTNAQKVTKDAFELQRKYTETLRKTN